MSINAFDQASGDKASRGPSPWQPGPPEPHSEAGSGRVWGYAGFWWRVLAWLIDSAVLWTIETALGYVAGSPHLGISNDATPPGQSGISNVAWSVQPEAFHPWSLQHWHVTAPGLADLLAFVLPLLYFTLLESSRWQATIGKRVCHLRVTGLDGGRISFWRALGRYAGKFVSAFILGIGFMMAGWTARKQALHDLMAETLVVRLRRPNDIVQFRPPPG